MIKHFLFFALIAFTVVSCTGPAGPEDVVEGYLKAHNSHDIEAVMEWYHENATLKLPGQPPITEIRKAEAWDAAISSNLIYEDWKIQGDTVIIGTITEKNNWFKKAGIAKIEYEPGTMMLVSDGKISKVIMAPITRESMEALNRMYEEFFTWLNVNYPGKLDELMPGGELTVNEDMATQWFALLDEWQRNK